MGFTPAMTLSGTYNPDYSQVEADALELDVNEPFAIFYPRSAVLPRGHRLLQHAAPGRLHKDDARAGVGRQAHRKQAGTPSRLRCPDELTNLLFPGSQGSTADARAAEQQRVLRYKRDVGSELTLGALVTDREGTSYYNGSPASTASGSPPRPTWSASS